MKPRSPRPGKLRTQVLAGVLLITLGALAVFDVAAVTAVRTYLIDRTNVTLKSALSRTRPQLHELLPAYRRPGSTTQVPTFGEYYIAFVPARGQVVNLQGVPGVKLPNVSAEAAANIVRPRLVKTGDKTVTGGAGPAFAGAAQFQLSAVSVPAFSGTLVAGTNVKDIDATVDQVRLIVATGSAAVAVLIFLGVGLVMRRGLRPIEVMASQADRITAGDLTDRVNPAEARSEVGRLGAALNGMLARIEASVAEGEASQELMRRFLAEASHELRTPLASLRANAELYTQGALTERSQVDEAMRRIMLEAQRMGRAGTPAQRPGSGLGLAIVTEIAAAHDGTVTAAANWPRGCASPSPCPPGSGPLAQRTPGMAARRESVRPTPRR